MKKVIRICTQHKLSHSEAKKVFKQLRKHPEVCVGCRIRPCTFSTYLWGKI